jgi:hypothetical protein
LKRPPVLWVEVLKAIDLYIGEYKSRSAFLETAAHKFIIQLKLKETEQRDLEIINRHADSLNAEVMGRLSPEKLHLLGKALKIALQLHERTEIVK